MQKGVEMKQGERVSMGELDILLRQFKADGVNIYEPERTSAKLRLLPDYVVDATYQGLRSDEIPANYYKAVLDKWGKRDSETKKYVETPEIVFYRAAKLAASGIVEKDHSLDANQVTREIFDKMVNREIFPNTPYMANGGHSLIAGELEERLDKQEDDFGLRNELKQEKKIREQLFACFVFDIYDSRESIVRDTLYRAAEIQAHVGGTGFNFSNLRPANESIHGTGGTTDGPVSFMAMYSFVLGKTMNQGGKREGANMFMLDWDHPDIMRFIYSKRKDGEISSANISIAIDHEFMESAKSDDENRFYLLKNPHYNQELRPHIPKTYSEDQLRQALEVVKMNEKATASLLIADNGVDVLSPWLPDDMGEEYRVIGKIEDGFVYLDAKKILRHISFGAWNNGEPGIIVTGHINDHNPTHPRHFRDYLMEQKDEEASVLVARLKGENPEANLESLVNDYVEKRDAEGRRTNLPVGVGEIRATNPCGEKPLLGNEACVLGHINLEKILDRSDDPSGYRINYERFGENTRLMVEILDNAIDQNEFTTLVIEKTQKSNRKIGIGFMGLANMLYRLERPYNSQETRDFVDEILAFWEKESEEVSFERGEQLGAFPNFRYSHHRNGKPKRNAILRTLAPTGTTAFAAQTTGGMEPEYALAYTRTTVQGTSIDMLNPVLEEKLEKYPFLRDDEEKKSFHDFVQTETKGKGSLQEFEITRATKESEKEFTERQTNLKRIKRIFVTAYDIDAEDHIRMEAVVQKHVDDAISKTTNFRSNASVEDVETIAHLAYDLGIKGFTFYRDGTRKGQPLKIGKSGGLEDKVEDRRKLTKMVSEILKRERPETVGGLTERTQTPFGNAYITLSWERDEKGRDIAPFETFVSIGKSGGDLQSLAEALARSISVGLQAGIPVEGYIKQFEGIGGETQVGVGEKRVRSFPDALAKALKVILQKEKKFTGDRESNLDSKKDGSSGNFCPSCGDGLNFEEGCEKCHTCGFSRC